MLWKRFVNCACSWKATECSKLPGIVYRYKTKTDSRYFGWDSAERHRPRPGGVLPFSLPGLLESLIYGRISKFEHGTSSSPGAAGPRRFTLGKLSPRAPRPPVGRGPRPVGLGSENAAILCRTKQKHTSTDPRCDTRDTLT